METRVIVVGGDFNPEGGKQSRIVEQIACRLSNRTIVHNGGTITQLQELQEISGDLIIWMPNIPNNQTKVYPTKPLGSVLICSKLMRPETTRLDAVSRIFKMHANAVIAIYPGDKYNFALIDALGNIWEQASHIGLLTWSILELYEWSKGQLRAHSLEAELEAGPYQDDGFIQLVKQTADRIEASDIPRFFGNCSTRCMKTFPSHRVKEQIYVSARNIDKQRITAEDMVPVQGIRNQQFIQYQGKRKPSIDTPVQLALYKKFPEINYMIHGHAFVEGAQSTSDYYPCGDMREYPRIIERIKKPYGVINLRQHGFLIYSDQLETLCALSSNANFC